MKKSTVHLRILIAAMIYVCLTNYANTQTTNTTVLYQCPMKCEGEKTYDKPGKCPVCGNGLKTKK